MLVDEIIYSCGEHVEEILEILIDEFEVMPLMNQVNDAEKLCQKCENTAEYQLLGSEVKAKWE